MKIKKKRQQAIFDKAFEIAGNKTPSDKDNLDIAVEALLWYADYHRGEDYLNDNGDKAIEALKKIGYQGKLKL